MGAMLTGIVAQEVIDTYSWRMMFMLGGSISLLLVIIAYFFLVEPPLPCQETLGYEQGESAKSGPNTLLDSSSITYTVKALFSPKYISITITFWLVFFLCFSTMYFIMSWLPKLLINEGFDPKVGQQAFSFFNLGGVIGTILIGILAIDKVLVRLVRYFLLIAFLLMIVFATYAVSENHIIITVFLLGLFFQGGFVGLYALTSLSYEQKIRATGLGFSIGLGRLGAVFGPAIAGYLIASGTDLSISYLFFSMPVFLAVLLLFKSNLFNFDSNSSEANTTV